MIQCRLVKLFVTANEVRQSVHLNPVVSNLEIASPKKTGQAVPTIDRFFSLYSNQ